MAVYAGTLCPTLAGGDSGELTTAAYTLGVAHPPGYPLFTILGKLFCLIPHGSIAWRVNLMSAICHTLAAVLLMLAVHRWTGDALAGFAAAGLLAFSPLFWRYSLVAEVFPLNDLFLSSLLYLAARYAQDREPRTAYVGALVFALGLSNHHTLIFAGGPLCLWALWTGRETLWRPRPLALLALACLAGFLPYLYLPIAGARLKISSWGDPDTLAGFLHHFLREDYGTFQGLPGDWKGPSLLKLSLISFAEHLPRQLLYVGAAAAAWGLISRLGRERLTGLAAATFAPFLFYLTVFQSRLNLPIDRPLYFDVQTRFWLMPDLLVAFWSGAGLADLRARIERRGSAGFFRALALVGACALVALQILVNHRAADQSGNRLVERFGRAILEPLPPGALLMTSGDLYINSTMYLQECEGVRKDVKVIDLERLKTAWMRRLVERNHPGVRLPRGEYAPETPSRTGVSYDVAGVFNENVDRMPIYINSIRKHSELRWKEYDLIPLGILYRVVRAGKELGMDAYLAESARAFGGLGPESFPPGIRADSWESAVREAYCAGQERTARHLVDHATGRPDRTEILRRARGIILELLAVNPNPPPLYHENLGIVAHELLGADPGLEPEMIRAWEEFLRTSPPDDPDIPAVRRALDSARARRP